MTPFSRFATPACWLVVCCLSLATALAQPPTTRPTAGLRDHTPNTYAWVGARITVSPGKVVPNGTIVIRDQVVLLVGPTDEVVLPPGTRVLDGKGKTIYPGWIDTYDAVDVESVESGQPYWNEHVQAQRRMATLFQVDEDRHESLRKAGVVARLVVPKSGVIQGTSVLVATTDQPMILADDASLHVRLTISRGRGDDEYPGSPMGAVALARQAFYDAQWYRQAWKTYEADPRVGRPEGNDALVSLAPFIDSDRLVIFDCPNQRYSLRSDRFAREFQLRAALLGSGREYRRLEAIAKTGRAVIVPLAFPKAPDVGTPEAARNVSLQTLMDWDHAPENPARLHAAGVQLAVTTWGIKPAELRKKIRQAVKRGWPADAALAALTIDAARLLGVDKQLGTLEPGKLAGLLVMDGDWLDEKTQLLETWVSGTRYRWHEPPIWDSRGTWEIATKVGKWTLKIGGTPGKLSGTIYFAPAADVARFEQQQAKQGKKRQRKSAAAAKLKSVLLGKISVVDDRLAIVFDGKDIDQEGIVRLSLTRYAKDNSHGVSFGGLALPAEPSRRYIVTARLVAKHVPQSPDKPQEPVRERRQAAFPVNYPLGAFGRSTLPEQPRTILFRNATVWTCADPGRPATGILESCDVLVEQGIIRQVGRKLAAPAGALVIDCRGKHLTPGIIDCHSHMATDGGVNEGTQAITAEVRIGDFINPDDINIYRQLAGGVTTSNILHGSANPIGGQNQVIKLRWGALGEEMKFAEAPAGIKFALGENVKQSNWGDDYTTRYPQTRMGVEQIMRDAFHEAKRYALRHRQWEQTHRGLPPRKDLELEALAEILAHKRWIHCHSYRQDEILALLRTLEEFQVRIGTLQHILEGYKIAGAMKRHGAMASAFSDWWAYKFEVYDAIPYNGAVMHEVGVVVSFNSDDREMARHLNHEAAKAVKYGGVSPEEALKFVTLNPAKQLRIDRWVGSIEPGKHADLVLWSGPPLSTLSRCEQTWVDGRKYFDIEEDRKSRSRFNMMKQVLIQRVLQSGAEMLKRGEENPTRDREWANHDEYCRCHPKQEEK